MQTPSEILQGSQSWGTETSPDPLIRLQGVLNKLCQALNKLCQAVRNGIALI